MHRKRVQRVDSEPNKRSRRVASVLAHMDRPCYARRDTRQLALDAMSLSDMPESIQKLVFDFVPFKYHRTLWLLDALDEAECRNRVHDYCSCTVRTCGHFFQLSHRISEIRRLLYRLQR